MNTIHLTDAQRDTFAATGLIVIDGEVFVSTAARDMIGDNLPGTYTLAPEGWRILTEPCDTCRGSGEVERQQYIQGLPRKYRVPCPNPDCVGSRRVVTLTADCPMTTERGAPQGSCPHELGRFTIPALLPVVEGNAPCPGTPHINVLHLPGDALVGLCDGAGSAPMIEAVFDPVPRPGQFIARPERVE